MVKRGFFFVLFFYCDNEGNRFLRNVRLSLSYSSMTDCQLARHPFLTLMVFQHCMFSLLNLQFTLLKMATLSLNAHRYWYVNLARHFIRAIPYTGLCIRIATEQCTSCFPFQPVLQTFMCSHRQKYRMATNYSPHFRLTLITVLEMSRSGLHCSKELLKYHVNWLRGR